MRTTPRTGTQPGADARRPAERMTPASGELGPRVHEDRLDLDSAPKEQTQRTAVAVGIVAAAALLARKVAETAEAARAKVTGALKGLLLSRPIALQAERQEAAVSEARQERRRRRNDERLKDMAQAAHVEEQRLAEALARLEAARPEPR
ncbi:MAG: hypothetical protein FJY99_02295 [Candidatus Sericytochromatia bacterium]|nr:hypothetical protein [Candidatus Tanganyikabacteria bacterium]